MTVTKSMRRDWDNRARNDAFYYIASWRTDWDLASFLASGEEDYERLVKPVLERAAFWPEGRTMLELGCGAGRMTHAFAKHFGQVMAFDVSSEMLRRARRNLNAVKNIAWIQVSGTGFETLADRSADFVFSYLVLQHLPSAELVRSYIREMHRVLRPGGLSLFQFNGSRRPTMNRRGHLAWGAIDALWSMGLQSVSRRVAQALRFDPRMAGKTWHGIAMPSGEVVESVQQAGGAVLELAGQNTAMAWCCARKAVCLEACTPRDFTC